MSSEPPWCVTESEMLDLFHMMTAWVAVVIESAQAHSKNNYPGRPNQKVRERDKQNLMFVPTTGTERQSTD